MKKGRLLSLLLTICMVLTMVPMVAYADEVIINDDPINVKTKDYSVDKSSISVDLFVIFRNKETGEEQPREGIDTITPENVTVGTFETIKTNAIEDAKTKLNEWLEIMRQANPDVQFMVVGDIVVEGDDAEFDNRTYTMKSDGDDIIIIGDEASGSTTGGSQTTSRYMEVNGDYGKKGNYSVTMTVEVQAVGEIPSYMIIVGANSTWTQDSDKTLVFRANGDIRKFTGVKVDDTPIDAENYTAVSGSTVITLKANYLNTLSVGTHKLTVDYNDGECSTNFEVKAASGQIILIDPSQPAEPAEPPQSNPNTGDNSMMRLCIALLVVSGTCMAAFLIHSRKNSMSD